jgi:hypothetical protein
MHFRSRWNDSERSRAIVRVSTETRSKITTAIEPIGSSCDTTHRKSISRGPTRFARTSICIETDFICTHLAGAVSFFHEWLRVDATREAKVSDMVKTRELGNLALAAGHSWAERKAETLEGTFNAIHWPDSWQHEWGDPLPLLDGEAPVGDLEALMATAQHAASERWEELVREHRYQESADEEELDYEARAVGLLEALEKALPEGLRVDREGERVFLVDALGREQTILSVPEAWRVVDDWRERRSS